MRDGSQSDQRRTVEETHVREPHVRQEPVDVLVETLWITHRRACLLQNPD